MREDMADSEAAMARLDKLEAGVESLNRSVESLNHAMVQVSEILLDQNQRLDHLGARLEGRLDRLIELQTRSLSDWVERHHSHDQRIAQLEERVDRLEK
jgi:uncharacterized coiled-coil protein SlyX